MIGVSSFLLFSVALLLCLLPQAGCARAGSVIGGGRDAVTARDPEYSIKQEALSTAPVPGAKPLKLIRKIQSDIRRRGALVFPAALGISNDGGVYISDNNAHVIHYWPPDSGSITTLPIRGQGRLVWPNWIEVWDDSILVTDNEGIKLFNTSGTFRLLSRIYYQIDHLTRTHHGAIYVNPSFKRGGSAKPLIVELDGAGKRVRGFGARFGSRSDGGLSDRVYLCATNEYVVAAYRHRPLVRIFDLTGKLEREFNVDHPAFVGLAALAEDRKFVHPEPGVYRLPKYIAGARAIDDRLLLLLDLPAPEIAELDFEGHEIRRYRVEALGSVATYQDFKARRAGDTSRFWMIVGDVDGVFTIAELSS